MAASQEPIVQQCVNTIKALAMDAVEKAKSGHPGTPMGLSSIAFELWTNYLRHDPHDPHWIGRDRFVLSAGHASMLLYALLHLSGYDLPLSELESFRQWGSKTPGHPEHDLTPGVETTTGPLGQGVGNAVGFALAVKIHAARFGQPFAPIRVFVIASDGDIMEGVSGEASSLAGHLELDNLIMIYDDNHITIDGNTSIAFSEDVAKRYEAYGWFVQSIDGHDHAQIRTALDRAIAEKDRPSFIRARTHIAQGAPHAVDTPEAHGAPLGEQEIQLTKKNMGWDPKRHFHIPQEVKDFFKEHGRKLAKQREVYNQQWNEWRVNHPKLAAEFNDFQTKKIPADLYEQLLQALGSEEEATRILSYKAQQIVGKLVPSLIGGAADLAASTKTLLKGEGDIARGQFQGRNIHFGIREHAMGAICNGLALFGGIIPYGSTFLIFSDYMRPSVRLSALMKLQCLWIYTHDSLFLGEDGPTHQPIEHLSSLHLIPDLQIVRPADGMEIAAAWVLALAYRKGPTAFALARQKLPRILRDSTVKNNDLLKGFYIVQEAKGGAPNLVLIATGSELHLAVGAKVKLEQQGHRVRVVSALSWEQFAKQDVSYQQAVLPPSTQKVSIEAGRTALWRKWVGEQGLCIGLDHFGASAPAHVLAEKFGFTVDAVSTSIQRWLRGQT
ncbi:transketolase [Pajaroellobacter abortibovis]|uniref:Transketolase n=1 Tax=Pajaroellobacter abortibovis TaxID=1882918 RepID=A0A1L6MX93_9BACT|nr:transketolase [Pajaroellobacter abortibovis]APS00076.1 transketolase [Pajaroellobacter abortibovis]